MTDLLCQAESEDIDGNQTNGRKWAKKDNSNADVAIKKKESIMRYVADVCRLVQKAVKVFELLDTSKRGSIDNNDLYRALQVLDMTASTDEATDTQSSPGKISHETIVDMMTEFKPVQRGDVVREERGVITATLDDIIRIAKLINL